MSKAFMRPDPDNRCYIRYVFGDGLIFDRQTCAYRCGAILDSNESPEEKLGDQLLSTACFSDIGG